MVAQPQLAPPGNGLPEPEAWASRNIVFPLVSRFVSPQTAISLVTQVGTNIIEHFEQLPRTQQTTPVLIKRLTGLEDSSRFWSPLMVIEHLLITGQAMQALTTELATGTKPTVVVRTQDVKPTTAQCTHNQILANYKQWLLQYTTQMLPLLQLPSTALNGLTHPHPWFGELTASQWLKLNGMHHRLHYNQFTTILKTT